MAARIIYAKLTSTGAYDVVAKTSNIELAAARELAEKMQLGNLPFGVSIGEELGYARPEAGGHAIARYTTYGWNDGRPAPPMTDLVWIDDAMFSRVRRNPFALVPHSDDVFAELTELAPLQVAATDAETELARIRELAGVVTDFTAFAAGVLSAESLLLVDTHNQVSNLELLVLLLAPRLRDRLTFQTCAYQPPQLRRRVTVADAMHANLRQANFSRVLPDEADTLTLNPAQRLTEFLDVPERLQRAHALYERLHEADQLGTFAVEAARLIRLADFLILLDGKLITEALRLIARATGSEAAIELAELEARFPPLAIAEAMVALFESGADEGALVQLLQAARGPAAASYHDALCNAVLATRREPSAELGVLLLQYLTAAGQADRAVRMHAALRTPGAVAGFPTGDPTTPLARYFDALTSRNRIRPLAVAAATLQAAAELYTQLRTSEARNQVELDCATLLGEAARALSLTALDVRDLRALQAAVDASAHEWNRKFASALLADAYLLRASPAELKQSATRIGAEGTMEWVGALSATLLARIPDSQDAELRQRLSVAAHALLAAHPDARVGARVAALLEHIGVSDGQLLEQPAFAGVLPLLGDTAREASLAQSLSGALQRLYEDGTTAPAELAAAVFNARANQQSIAAGTRAFTAVVSALRQARERGLTARYPVQTELALDLLAFAADPIAFRQIESATLGRTDAIAVRLRRLDRAISEASAAQDEQLYHALADALESNRSGIDAAARQRLRNALGTTGMHRRIMEAFNSVVQRSTP